MAIPLGAIAAGVAQLPAIVAGISSGFELFTGGSKAAVVATGGPGFPGAGPVPVGTSVGPIGSLAGGDFVQAGFAVPGASAILPAVKKAIPFIVGAVVGEQIGTNGTALVPGRRQQILAVARANSPGATSKKIIRAAKECGIEIAAATFGLDVISVCFLLAQPASRRSRGISAAEMRRTRSTIRKVSTIQKQLKALSGPIRRYGSK